MLLDENGMFPFVQYSLFMQETLYLKPVVLICMSVFHVTLRKMADVVSTESLVFNKLVFT